MGLRKGPDAIDLLVSGLQSGANAFNRARELSAANALKQQQIDLQKQSLEAKDPFLKVRALLEAADPQLRPAIETAATLPSPQGFVGPAPISDTIRQSQLDPLVSAFRARQTNATKTFTPSEFFGDRLPEAAKVLNPNQSFPVSTLNKFVDINSFSTDELRNGARALLPILQESGINVRTPDDVINLAKSTEGGRILNPLIQGAFKVKAERISARKEEAAQGRFETTTSLGIINKQIARFDQRTRDAIKSYGTLESQARLLATGQKGPTDFARLITAVNAQGARPTKEDFDNIKANPDLVSRVREAWSSLANGQVPPGLLQNQKEVGKIISAAAVNSVRRNLAPFVSAIQAAQEEAGVKITPTDRVIRMLAVPQAPVTQEQADKESAKFRPGGFEGFKKSVGGVFGGRMSPAKRRKLLKELRELKAKRARQGGKAK